MTRLPLAALALLAAAPAWAGPERVAFPADYPTRFVQYNQVERPDRKPPVIRCWNPRTLFCSPSYVLEVYRLIHGAWSITNCCACW